MTNFCALMATLLLALAGSANAFGLMSGLQSKLCSLGQNRLCSSTPAPITTTTYITPPVGTGTGITTPTFTITVIPTTDSPPTYTYSQPTTYTYSPPPPPDSSYYSPPPPPPYYSYPSPTGGVTGSRSDNSPVQADEDVDGSRARRRKTRKRLVQRVHPVRKRRLIKMARVPVRKAKKNRQLRTRAALLGRKGKLSRRTG